MGVSPVMGWFPGAVILQAFLHALLLQVPYSRSNKYLSIVVLLIVLPYLLSLSDFSLLKRELISVYDYTKSYNCLQDLDNKIALSITQTALYPFSKRANTMTHRVSPQV